MTEWIIVRWAGHGASLPAAVDAPIPLSRGVDKLRTVCGRPAFSPLWEAPAAMPPTADCPGRAVQDTFISKGGNLSKPANGELNDPK
jgi:hypothetical protein